jgi:hypothetical protein
MKKMVPALLVLTCWLFALGHALAQETAKTSTPPPKVLTIFREFVKPGKTGSAHEKSESAFLQAMRHANWPTHYLAIDSVSGKQRSLFLTGYDTFEAWEKDVLATQKNSVLSAALDHAATADGELLSEADASAWSFNEGYSLRVGSVEIPHMRYFDIAVFHVKPGHEKDWDEGMKLVLAAYEKIPDAHWAAYTNVYGAPGGTYAFFTPMKSASEVDRVLSTDKDFAAAMGADGMKKLSELSQAAIESSETNLFVFNPRMSYVADEWIKADPDFWKPKAASAPAGAKKPAEKTPEAAKPQ